jgi:2-C-methyl-D-erythritol 4-phosphate cytidylyltransferase/2-C-methyl-D-erythritol 2,4-cyclodiphosphate synthase
VEGRFEPRPASGGIRAAARSALGALVNVDATLIAEAPSSRPHADRIRAAIGGALGIAVERVSVKATTNERLRLARPRRGPAACAVALVELP